ncbi:purine-nucleoside phosphorylase [Sulfuricurvum sp.]|uniref:phosphorylase family protein n=1 Tax=Sulfuricurvum sp. TaxID=2025608 RepID=UPI00262AB031|nr:purine-nucleoside phosphorylase [Sulfuricurvum sp.]MDD4883637.1 purine-nucleoside phosphorylase [Sulfuricurvum sp.]
MIVCAGNNETFDFATPIGVGLIDSAINLTRHCLVHKPEFLFFVGSAGSYGGHKIHELIESKTAANIELGFLDERAYTPIDNVVSAQTENIKDVIVNCSNYITTSEDAMMKFTALGMGIENMEFFSVMRVAQVFGIPAGGVFCVTNYCDANAHRDFIANHGFAKVLLREHLVNKGMVRA